MTIEERAVDAQKLEILFEQLEILYRQLRHGDNGSSGELLRAGRTLEIAALGIKYGLPDLPSPAHWPDIEWYANNLRAVIKK